MAITLKRIYEKPTPGDGYRVLVDRLWPRGISKETAKIDEWIKDEAPSHELRKWYHKNKERWDEFRKRYLVELKGHQDKLYELAQRSGREQVTLLFSVKDEERNHAVILREYLEKKVSASS